MIGDEPIRMNFQVEWKMFNDIGDEVDGGNPQFATEKGYTIFIKKMKKSATSRKLNLLVDVRDLNTQQLIDRRFKKKDQKNFKRR